MGSKPQPLYKQGDVVFINDAPQLPNGSENGHPFLIISSNYSNGYENYYTGVMLTHNPKADKFSFFLENAHLKDFSLKSGEVIQARLYITAGFRESCVRYKKYSLTTLAKAILIERFKEVVLQID